MIQQNGVKVLASCYNDPTGNRGNDLFDGGFYYAELSTNPAASKGWDYKALGGLPNNHKLKITYKGMTIVATKGDVGRGGRNHPKIDLHETLSKALNFNGLDYVTVEGLP